MKFLVDEYLSPNLADALNRAGHDAVHVGDVGLRSADDQSVLDHARSQPRTILSADTDFGTLLAASREATPSVILVRLSSPRRTSELSALLQHQLPDILDAISAGSIIVIEDSRIRVRPLPLLS